MDQILLNNNFFGKHRNFFFKKLNKMDKIKLNIISFGKHEFFFLFNSFLICLNRLFFRLAPFLIRSFSNFSMGDKNKDSSIEKMKTFSHKNTTQNQYLQENKKQSSKQASLRKKKEGQNKSIKGSDLKENRKKSPRQGQLKGKGLENTTPPKSPSKGPDLKENKKHIPRQGQIKGKGLENNTPPKGPSKGPDLKENKKDFPRQGSVIDRWLGNGKPTKGLDLQENGKKATDQSKINGKELGDRNSPRGQSLEENRIRSRQQPNSKGKGSVHQNSPKGQNLQENKNQVSDPSSLVVKFTNLLMVDGKKTQSLSTLSKSLKLFKKYIEDLTLDDQIKQNSINTKKTESTLNYLHQAVLNIKPSLEVRKKKISGIMRQIPAIPSSNRKETLGIRWIIESARKRKKKNYKPFHQCLAEELLDAFQSQGEPYKRKQALHKTAEGNRTYIRHRWW